MSKEYETKFFKKHGVSASKMAEQLKVNKVSIRSWDKKGLNFKEQSERLNLFRGNRKLTRVWSNINRRCSIPSSSKYEYYGGKGISVEISRRELRSIWDRDGASKMKIPSIDRIDSNKNYELNNCRFV